MITQSYNLNLIPGGVPLRIPCSQRDAGSRTVVLYLFNGSERFTGSASGVIQGTRVDGEAFTAVATVASGVATFTVSLDMTASAGAHKAELVLTDGSSNVLGTANFVLDVEVEAMDPDITPTTEEQTLWESMRSQTATLAANAQASATAAAGSAEDAEDYATAAQTAASNAQSIVDSAVASLLADADTAPTSGSTDLVLSGGVYTALAAKQDALTFDNAPTENSTNPVTSGGVFSALTKLVPLWSQSESTTSFAAQTVSVPGLSGYDGIYIRLKTYYNYTQLDSALILRLGDTSTIHQISSIGMTDQNNHALICYRTATINWTSNTIAFASGRYESGAASGNNSYAAIPIAIYGIKL